MTSWPIEAPHGKKRRYNNTVALLCGKPHSAFCDVLPTAMYGRQQTKTKPSDTQGYRQLIGVPSQGGGGGTSSTSEMPSARRSNKQSSPAGRHKKQRKGATAHERFDESNSNNKKIQRMSAFNQTAVKPYHICAMYETMSQGVSRNFAASNVPNLTSSFKPHTARPDHRQHTVTPHVAPIALRTLALSPK